MSRMPDFEGLAMFSKVAEERSFAATWGQVFLKYLLGNPAITAVIPGTSDPDHMRDDLAAGRGPMPDAKQRAALVGYFESLG